MKPVLYAAGLMAENDFKTMGFGTLSDAAECLVTEERNGEYILDMVYPASGRHYSDIMPGRIIYAYPCAQAERPQPFEISYISPPMSGLAKVQAIHAAQVRAAYITVNPTYTTQASAQNALDFLKQISAGYSADAYPVSFYSNITLGAAAKFLIDRPKTLKEMLYGSEGSALDVYGGEYYWNHDTISLLSSRGHQRNVRLTYGKNIAEISEEINLDGIATTIYPYWFNGTDYVYASASRIIDSSHVSDFAYKRIVPVDVTNSLGTDTTPTQAQVYSAGEQYIKANQIGVPDVTLSVKFFMISQTSGYEQYADLETVKMCDSVIVDYPPLGISMSAKVVKTVWDVLRNRYESIEVGTVVKPSLATAILKYVR